jgi:hypothetical protein
MGDNVLTDHTPSDAIVEAHFGQYAGNERLLYADSTLYFLFPSR